MTEHSSTIKSRLMPTPTTEFWSYDLNDESPNYDDGTPCTEAIAALIDVAEAAQELPEVQRHIQGIPCLHCSQDEVVRGVVAIDNTCPYRAVYAALCRALPQ